jgi:hypothetical protein
LWASILEPIVDKGTELRTTVFLLIWRSTWWHHHQLRNLQQTQSLLEQSRQAVASRNGRLLYAAYPSLPSGRPEWYATVLPKDWWTLGFYDRLRYWCSASGLAQKQAFVGRAVRMETMRELAVAALALKRYELRHHALPPALTALAPEFLPEAPRDYADGQPLHYRPDPDGTFQLDGVHHDGAETDRATPPWRLETSRDLIWPKRASAKDLEAADPRRWRAVPR